MAGQKQPIELVETLVKQKSLINLIKYLFR